MLNGTEANCDGKNGPYGATPGQYLERTCAVEFDNGGKYESHPWGLRHMHGNVWKLCENKCEQSNDSHVHRGGSWGDYARGCRAAYRYYYAADYRINDIGFRVCVRLD